MALPTVAAADKTSCSYTETRKEDEAMSQPVKTNLLTKMLLSTTTDRPSRPHRTRAKNTQTTKTATVNMLPPCRICGHPASGFHYGVNACEACKRFFRRATRRKRHFKCRGMKQCSVRGPERTLCGYCRYMRCLALGMSNSNIKTGRYSHEKRAQDISEVQKLRVKSFDTLCMSEAEVRDVVQTLMEGQRSIRTNETVSPEVIRERVKKKHETFTLLQNLIGPHRLISTEEYREVYERTGLDVDGRKQRLETWMNSIENSIEGLVKFCKSIRGFCDLSLHDQTNLLKLSRVEVWFLGAFKGFHADLEMIHAPNGNCHHSSELSQVLGPDYLDCAFQLSSRLRNLDLTPEENVLTKAICVMSADRCQLDDPRKVEEKQWLFVKCLLHLIAKDESREPGLYSRVISALLSLRNLTDISRRYLTNILVVDAAKNHPVLLELL